VLRLPRLRELDLSRNELLRALPDDLAALESLETLDVTETALAALPVRLFDLPRLRRVAADAELLVAPAGWTAAEGALERCVVAAASSRARPPVAAPRRRAFATGISRPKQNAADVRDLLRTRLSLTDADLNRVLRRGPLGARATVEPKLQWLQARLDLDAAQLRKIVVRHPQLLTLSVERMESNCDWLQSRIDLDDVGLRKMVLRLPSLLGNSVEANMAPTLEWLQTRLDLDDAGLRKVVLMEPQLLSYSVEDNMEPKLDWLRRRLDLDDVQLRKMVLTLPSLLGFSVEDNMEPKLVYLEREIGLSRPELREHVLRIPAILAYSLDKRYRQRVEACRAAGVDPAYAVTTAPYTDDYFYGHLGRLEKKRAQM
jgi:hypothetical protein